MTQPPCTNAVVTTTIQIKSNQSTLAPYVAGESEATSIRRPFDGNSTSIRLLMEGH